MEFKDIKQFKVEGRIATPYFADAYQRRMFSIAAEHDHTYATDAQDGIHESEMFDSPVLQHWSGINEMWMPAFDNVAYNEYSLRYYLPLKPVEKELPAIVVPKGYWNCGGCEMDYDTGSLGDDSKCPVCGITCDMVLIEDHPMMVEPEVKQQGREWISVEDFLPQVDGYYLTHGSLFGGLPSTKVTELINGKFITSWIFTHWMPLPSPPKSK